MFLCTVDAEEFVFKQGDDATCFFIILQGELRVIINEHLKRQLKQWDTFGELALLYNAPRSASIQVSNDTTLLAIKRDAF